FGKPLVTLGFLRDRQVGLRQFDVPPREVPPPPVTRSHPISSPGSCVPRLRGRSVPWRQAASHARLAIVEPSRKWPGLEWRSPRNLTTRTSPSGKGSIHAPPGD